MKDANGRIYARLCDLKTGDKVQVDEGFTFTCLLPGEICVIHEDDHGLYIKCAGPSEDDELKYTRNEHHYLDDQIADDEDQDGDSLIGVYKL